MCWSSGRQGTEQSDWCTMETQADTSRMLSRGLVFPDGFRSLFQGELCGIYVKSSLNLVIKAQKVLILATKMSVHLAQIIFS